VAEKDKVTELLQSSRKVVQLYRTPGLSDSKTKTLLSKVLLTHLTTPSLQKRDLPVATLDVK